MKKQCSVSDCSRPSRGRGLCGMHYQRWRQSGDPLVVCHVAKAIGNCGVEGCGRKVVARGLCGAHWQRRQNGKPLSGPIINYERHGHASRNGSSSEYHSWADMISRCTNPSDTGFHNYGAMGTCVCEIWLNSFSAFLRDMGQKPTPKHTIDRINNNGNYEPGNCRWATMKEQLRNTSRNVFVSYYGKRMTVAELSEVSGVRYAVLCGRIYKGWDVVRAVTTPIRFRSCGKLTR